MTKLYRFLLISFFSSGILTAQEVDSLKQILPGTEGHERAELLIQLAKLSGRSNSESRQRILYAHEAIELAKDLGDSLLLAHAYYEEGEANYYLAKYPEAIAVYEKALDVYQKKSDSVNIGECYNSIGLCHYDINKYDLAISNLLNALEVYEKLNLKGKMANVHSNMGVVYDEIDDWQLAIKNYRQASYLNKAIQDTLGLAINYNGLGTSYFFLEKYDSAKLYYSLAYRTFKELEEHRSVAIMLNNIANIYVNQGDSLSLALQYYNEAIQVFREIDDKRSEAAVMKGLSGVYRKMGQYDKSIKSFIECIEFCKENQVGFNLLKLAYSDLAFTYEKNGDITKAYETFKLYSQYSDSLFNSDRINQVAELREKYETEKKEAEIERLNAVKQVHLLKLEREKQIRLFGAVLILLLIIITLFISIGYMNKKKTNKLLNHKNVQIELQRKELEKMNASKNKFFSIIAHDLKNPFHTIIGYSYLMHKHYDRFKEEERKKYATDIYQSANSIFRLLQNLLDWSKSQTERLKFDPQPFNLSDLYENMIGILKPAAEAKKIKIEHSIEEGSIAYADPMMVETIILNLINNAIKFSFEESTVKLNVSNKNNKLLICIEDNGTGIHENDLKNLFRIDSKVKRKGTNNEDGSGLGLILCREFVKKNGGTLTVESEQGKGSRFSVTLPGTSGNLA